jgi:hypothetical protein
LSIARTSETAKLGFANKTNLGIIIVSTKRLTKMLEVLFSLNSLLMMLEFSNAKTIA